MGRTRARVLAIVVVLGATVGSALALEVWPGGGEGPPQSNPQVRVGSAGRVIFSIRNDSTTELRINGFTPIPNGDCDLMNLPVPLGAGSGYPVFIPATQMRQFVVTTKGPGHLPSSADYQCAFTIETPEMGSDQVTTVFHASAAATFDLQPRAMNFGTRMLPEKQGLQITNWGSNAQVELELQNNTHSFFQFQDCLPGGATCSVTLPPMGSGFGTASVVCTPGMPTTVNASVVMKHLGSAVATTAVTCTGTGMSVPIITLMPDPRDIISPVGVSRAEPVDIDGSGSTTSISVTSGFSIDECSGVCPSMSLPTQINVRCTPTASMFTGMLSVSAGSAMATSAVRCIPDTSNLPPTLRVMPSTIDFSTMNVFGTGSAPVMIDNAGSGSLSNIVVSFTGTGTAHFSADECTTAQPCSLGSKVGRTITVYFTPQSHGLKTATMQVTADEDGPEFVMLEGVGTGGVMSVTNPSTSMGFHLPLGTIPVGQVANAMITLANLGNTPYDATISGVMEPYSMAQTTGSVDPSTPLDFAVECGSNMPSTTNMQTWSITSNAYAGSAQDITVSCSVVDTNGVTVMPLSFDFGDAQHNNEVRTGTATQTKTVTVTNPSTNTGAATIRDLKFRLAKAGLTLTPPNTTTTLQPGTSTEATLTLTPTEDVDLDGQFVDIGIGSGSAMLELPVRGKVVTAKSRIAPARLDLGTACVGSEVAGTVNLINDGTATLRVESPQMDQTFFAVSTGATYPLQLPASMSATAQITPSQTATGALASTLTWRDDVPNTFEVPITLEYIDDGTAVSPRTLDFGVVPVDELSGAQRITFENCGDSTGPMKITSLRGLRGPIGAWKILPRVGFSKQLGMRERQAVEVAFQGIGRGRYEAELVVETKSGFDTIRLIAEATGRDFDKTSFYTCGCGTPGAPWKGWPVALAIVVVSVRRRRGSSSAR